MKNIIIKLILATLFSCVGAGATQFLNQKKPDNIVESHWASLKSAVLQEAKLLPSATGISGESSHYGQSVDIDGNRAVVGAPYAQGNGVAYVYDFDGSNWNLTDVLLPLDTANNNQFGYAVSLVGNRIIVGDFSYNGVGNDSGAVYVFEYDGNNWHQAEKLISSDIGSNDRFAMSIDLSVDRMVVGAQSDDDDGSSSGSAYIFDYNGGVWSETKKLTASDAASSDLFGNSVSLSGDRVLIGAYGNDDGGSSSGSAYIFDYDGNNWTETVKLVALDDDSGDSFGTSVALLGDRAVIAATEDSIPAITSSSGAVYVFDFNGGTWQETIKLTASDETSYKRFGNSVSLSATRLVIGAKGDRINSNSRTGSAYIFDYNGSNWVETEKIIAADGARDDAFGTSVAHSGDRSLFGAIEDDDNGTNSGSSYVFDFDGISWLQTNKLTAPDSSAGDQYGTSVSLYNDLALVGSPFDDDLGSGSGSAYLYQFLAGNWSLVTKFSGSDTSASHQFGRSVSIYNSRIMIGATSARNSSNVSSGAVYVFDFDGSNWVETTKLSASDGDFGDRFGVSISLESDRVIIGAESDDINSSFRDSGAAYVFDYNGTSWSQTTKLTAFDRNKRDFFGHSVALSGDKVIVGSFGDDAGSLTDFGSAYVYEFNGNHWSPVTKLIASDAANFDNFGTSVSLLGNRALIGASGDDDNGSSSGSAYVFDFDGTQWIESDKLVASGPSNNNRFGHSTSLQNDKLVVGTSIASIQGSAFVFDFDGTTWNQTGVLQPSNDLMNDFGISVSIFGDKVIGGANNHNEYGSGSGAAYIFDLTAFSVAGTVTGLASGNELILQNNLGDDTVISADGSFKFNTGFLTGASYNVTVLNQPTAPSQTCVITNGNGTINGADINNVSIVCTTNTYTIGLTVSGLASANNVTLQNNLGDNLVATSNGSLTFATALDDESVYDVTVLIQPTTPNQECLISNGNSVLSGFDVVDITVICTTIQYTFSGNLTGLATGNSLVIQNNLLDDLILSVNGNFIFTTALDDESVYSVTVLTQPSSPNQSCQITDGSGILAGVDISNITIECTTLTYSVGGVLSGLSMNNTLVLQNNLTDNLVLTSNGVFTFPTLLDDGTNYAVTVLTQPSTPNQTCLITGGNSGSNNGAGAMAGTNESSVIIVCNSEPVVVIDNYTINEDTLLTANDANGTNNNQDGVLANDSDAETDPLSVVSPGTFTADGVGGLITINADGTFVFIPPTDISGQATFSFIVTDGLHQVASTLNVDVLPVNDTPSFEIEGNIDTVPLVSSSSNSISIPDFAHAFNFGAPDESMQNILQFNLIVFSDFDNILNGISMTNDGTLIIDLTRNDGIANIGISMQDDGGTANNGDDTSAVVQFTVSYIDSVFSDGYEELTSLKLFDYIQAIQSNTSKDFIVYDFETNAISFYNQNFELTNDEYSLMQLYSFKKWLQETLQQQNPFGDYDKDGIKNLNDNKPFWVSEITQ